MKTRMALLGVFVTGLFLCSGTGTIAKAPPPKKEEEKAKDRKMTNVVRAGFTRPGNPQDPVGDDNVVRPIAWDPAWVPAKKGKILGGTVYFIVLERTGAEGDPWGTGIADFTDRFVEGKSFNGGFSQSLDTKAKYLYLYMVVNDRGLDPTKDRIAPAAAIREDFDKKMSPIASTALRLVVDPRYLTSWGYFKKTGFTVEVPDAFGAEQKPVADNLVTKIRMAVSGNTSYLEQIPETDRRYMDVAPANPLGDLRNTFAIGSSNENGTKTNLYKGLVAKRDKAAKGGDIKLLGYEKTLLQACEKGGMNPDFVHILYSGFDDRVPPAVIGGDEGLMGQAVFRADFRGKNLVDLGEQSVLFGFTTDLPPIDEGIRIEDPAAAVRGNGIVPVNAPQAQNQPDPANDLGFVAFMQQGQGVAPAAGSGVAPGTAVTPAPPVGGTSVLGGGFGGLLGGQSGGGGGGSFPVAGGIGFARPGLFGGGGGGGLGSGTNQGSGTQSQAQSQTQTPTGTTINFTVTQANVQTQAQLQAQLQAQAQLQNQHNHNHGGHHGNHNNVIPAPPAFLLGLLGLPAFVFFRRRKVEVAAL